MRPCLVALGFLVAAGCTDRAPQADAGAALAPAASSVDAGASPAPHLDASPAPHLEAGAASDLDAGAAPDASSSAVPAFARARVFVFNRKDQPKSFCFAILDGRGKLCPTAEEPGVLLSRAQIDAVLRAAAEPPLEPNTAPLCFDPHHGVVFYDELERPLSALSVCFECERQAR